MIYWTVRRDGDPMILVKRSLWLPVALVVWVALATDAAAQSGGVYTLESKVIAGGGATFSTGGVYSLGATIGQHDASGPMTGGSYSLTGGFWPRIAVLLKGDADGNGTIAVADVFYLINALFSGGPAVPACVGDVNNDTFQTVGDVFALINYLFAGGPAPSPPNC